MKKLLLLFGLSAIAAFSFAQSVTPNCSHLYVQDIKLDNDTAGLLKITIGNSCTNCASGLNGCVYLELKMIRAVSPFDTLAASKCYCYWSPDNGSQSTYLVPSSLSSLPQLNTLRVSLFANCGCDTIPFALVTGLLPQESSCSFNVFPNPARDILNVQSPRAEDLRFKIYDLSGKAFLSNTFNTSGVKIDLSSLASGFYILELSDKQNSPVHHSKISKE